MKTIATINFKGGVGKTTVTWCLGDVLSQGTQSKVLLFDLDAQMSMTQSILLDTSGYVRDQFNERNQEESITLYSVLKRFLGKSKFDFHPEKSFIYELHDNYHFVPSTEELYWLELGRKDPVKGKFFIKELLGKIGGSKELPKYDYALFDCPPSLTLISYSVLTCCDLILVPINPDFFAAKGVDMLLTGLRERIKPHPFPTTVVFANRVKTWRKPTHAARKWIAEVKTVCTNARARLDIDVHYADAWIPDRAAIRDAITERTLPEKHVDDFTRLWSETKRHIK